ncbi:MAG: hypothetical protein NG740_03045 [Omnitrophica bacterium]|nr:hypothetical protein [Candidatus Omnitrophota bacterium]
MRLKEEKTLITIEIITLISVVVASILLQFVDAKITDHDKKILNAELKRSHCLQLAGYHRQRVEYWELSGSLAQLAGPLKKELVLEDDPIVKPENVGGEYKRLMAKYKANEIDAYTYTVKRGNIHRKKAEYYKSRLKQVSNGIESLIKNPPELFLINILLLKRICFVVQLAGTFIAIMLLIKLFIEINERTRK